MWPFEKYVVSRKSPHLPGAYSACRIDARGGDDWMPHLLIRHTVKDFGRWKACFDRHAETRRSIGSKGGRLLRSSTRPNEIVLLFEWEDLDLARRFSQSENLRAVMQEAGVNELPDILLLDDVESLPA
jgi:hypothetical protein